jgi:hypothetical protein
MTKKKDFLGNSIDIFTKKSRGRSKPKYRRGCKKLGPKDADRGNRGNF